MTGFGWRAPACAANDAVPASGLGRLARPLAFGLSVALLVLAAVVFDLRWHAFASRGYVGVDYDTYLTAARRWLDTGSMYFPYQVQGPYVLKPWPYTADIMPGIYPPHMIYLFAPFLVLPSVLWWAVPLGVTAYVIAAFRPAPWTWPIMAGLVALPDTLSGMIVGNTTMWLMAFVACGLRWNWPSVLVTLKPSLLPFALIGSRHRSWWAAAVIVGLASLPMLPLWFDYARAVENAGQGPLFSLSSVPALLLPVVAWLGRSVSDAETGPLPAVASPSGPLRRLPGRLGR